MFDMLLAALSCMLSLCSQKLVACRTDYMCDSDVHKQVQVLSFWLFSVSLANVADLQLFRVTNS